MARVFLSLGSNLGDRRSYLDRALQALGRHGGIRVVACSHVYETEPWPEVRVERARWYLNCAVEIETELSPYGLLRVLRELEMAAGRVRIPAAPAQYSHRTLDIDILLYGDRVVSDYELQIPHPLLHERRFVLTPLADIAPEVEHPTLYQSVRELLAELSDTGRISLYSE